MNVVVTEEVRASAEQIWAVIRDFKTLAENNAAIESCVVDGEGEGATRTLVTGGVTVKERLDALDDNSMTLTYSIVEGDLPITDYQAQVTIEKQSDESSIVHWQGQCEPAGIDEATAKTLVRGIYVSSIAGLKQLLNGA